MREPREKDRHRYITLRCSDVGNLNTGEADASVNVVKKRIIENHIMNTQRVLSFAVAVVSEFAVAHNMTPQEAFRYLDQHKGIDFIERHYEVEHTLSFDDVVEDLTKYCHRMGGGLS